MKFIKNLRRRKHIKKLGQLNTISVPDTARIKINIYGKNNTVIIDRPECNFRGNINIYGDNNVIRIENGYDTVIDIDIGAGLERRTNNCTFNIGRDLYCGGAYVMIGEDGFNFSIGNDCMLSSGIDIYGTDGHTITNSSGEILNIGRNIKIGNHVWIGKDVKINKNTIIADNCIVGWGAIVTRQFIQSNVTIAGNPAKIVKENVHWERTFTNNFIKSNKE